MLLTALVVADSVSASRAGGRASAASASGAGILHANEVSIPRVDVVLDEPLITPSGLDVDTAKVAATVTGGQAVAEVSCASRKT